MSTLKNEATKNQKQLILEDLQSGKKLTPLDALNKYGCFRLGARIWDLKQDGHQIKKEMVATQSGKSVACYSLIKDAA